MSNQMLNTLAQAISPQYVVAFFLVLARITPLFIIGPVFSSPMLIPRVRSVLAAAFAIGLVPIASHGQHIPTAVLPVLGLLLENLLVGFALAFAIACVFGAVQAAGVLADNLSGFSFGQTVDPINGNPGGALTNFYTMVGTILFLVIGGDAWTLRGINATFTAVPIGRAVADKPLVYAAESAFASLLVGAVEIAAPLMLAIVVSDVAFGMVSKVVPQMNIFAVGFPVKVGVSLIVVGVSLPFLGGWLSGQLESTVSSAVHSLSIL